MPSPRVLEGGQRPTTSAASAHADPDRSVNRSVLIQHTVHNRSHCGGGSRVYVCGRCCVWSLTVNGAARISYGGGGVLSEPARQTLRIACTVIVTHTRSHAHNCVVDSHMAATRGRRRRPCACYSMNVLISVISGYERVRAWELCTVRIAHAVDLNR